MAGKVKLSSALIAIDGLAISMLGASSVAGHQTVQPHPMAIKRGILEQARQFDFIVIAGPAIGADVWFDAFAHSTDEVIVAVDQMAPANDQLMGDLARLENSGHGARGVVMTA
jgi:septum formation inhibitor-activating ATPase MinD